MANGNAVTAGGIGSRTGRGRNTVSTTKTTKRTGKSALRTASDMRKYQWRAFWFVMRNQINALFMDMGLGKTIILLSAIKAVFHKGHVTKPVLLVAPVRVIYTVWRQGAARRAHTRSLRFSLVHGNERQRLAALDVEADVYMINFENLVWLLRCFSNREALSDWPFYWLIIDESSAFKAAGSKRFTKLKNFVHLFKRRTILTGTPRPNGLLDL